MAELLLSALYNVKKNVRVSDAPLNVHVTYVFAILRVLYIFSPHPPLPPPILHPIAFSVFMPWWGVVGSARELYAKPPTAPPLWRLHLEISKTDVTFYFNKLWYEFLRNIYFSDS